jgi:tetratricopeptide (TPR) repeat protein
LLCDLGKYEDADRLLRAAEGVSIEAIQGDWNVLPAMRLFRSVWLLDHFQCDQATITATESLRLVQKTYGESHISTADYRGVVGKALLNAGRLAEAEALLLETVKIREEAPDSCPLDFADNLITLAELFIATDRPSEAENAAKRAAEMIEDRVLPTNLMLAELNTVLAQISSKRGRHDEAVNRLREAEEIRLQVQPCNHPRLAGLYTAAALVYSAVDDKATAEHYRSQAVKIQSRRATH